MDNRNNNDVDYWDEGADTPRLVVCDLGEVNWVKVEPGLILVNYTYVCKIERNRRG